MSQPAQTPKSSLADLLKASSILGALFKFACVNVFLFAAISLYLGGLAFNTLPSQDGFVLLIPQSDGPLVNVPGWRIPVSESVWLFSLIYGHATLLLTPPITFFYSSIYLSGRTSSDQLIKPRGAMKWLICGLILAWCVAWYGIIGTSLYRSVSDWSQLQRRVAGAESSKLRHPAQPRQSNSK
jgi:hypothetical protein